MEHFHERPDGGKFEKIETTSTERFRHFSRDGNHLTAAGVWKTFQNVRSRSLLVVEVKWLERSLMDSIPTYGVPRQLGFNHLRRDEKESGDHSQERIDQSKS